MPPPSYPHRHLLLSQLLDSQSIDPPSSSFTVAATTLLTSGLSSARQRVDTGTGTVEDELEGDKDEIRGRKLDTLLLIGWKNGRSSVDVKGKQKAVDKDVLHHAENLRIKVADFQILGRIGEGQFGNVDAVRCKLDGKVYAMKTVNKTTAIRAGNQLNLGIERHIHLLSSLTISSPSNPFTNKTALSLSSPSPRLIAAFQSMESLHMIMTYAACGSLWDRMCGETNEATAMEEDEIEFWASQMVFAISWLHEQGFVHRDIKPHNFLICANSRLELTDFGSAAPLHSGRVPMTHCILPAGTPDYVAPEILRVAEDAMLNLHYEAIQSEDKTSKARVDDDVDPDRTIRPRSDQVVTFGYGSEVDWWSLGATMYEMTTGKAPFWASSIKVTYDKIMRYDVQIPNCSLGLRNLLSGLLSPPEIRLGRNGAKEIKSHDFFIEIDWEILSKGLINQPSSFNPPQPMDLHTLTDSFVQSDDMLGGIDEMTFDHFFNSTIGVTGTDLTSISASPLQSFAQSTSHISSPQLNSSPQGSEAPTSPALEPSLVRWVGWSLDPPSDFFGHEPPSPSIGPTTVSGPPARTLSTSPTFATTPLSQQHQYQQTFVTPIRPTSCGGVYGSASVPRTAPRSVPRTRPVSERQAFAQLVACVQASARKKLDSSLSKKMPGNGINRRNRSFSLRGTVLGQDKNDGILRRQSSRASLFKELIGGCEQGENVAVSKPGDGEESKPGTMPMSASSSVNSTIRKEPPTPTPITKSRDTSINTGAISKTRSAFSRQSNRDDDWRNDENMRKQVDPTRAAISAWVESTTKSLSPGPGGVRRSKHESNNEVRGGKGGIRTEQVDGNKGQFEDDETMERLRMLEKWYGQIEEGYKDLEERLVCMTARFQTKV